MIPLENFFKKNSNYLFIIEQPLPGSDDLNCIYRIFNEGRLIFVKKGNFFGFLNKLCDNSNKTYISLKIRDVLTTIYFFFL